MSIVLKFNCRISKFHNNSLGGKHLARCIYSNNILATKDFKHKQPVFQKMSTKGEEKEKMTKKFINDPNRVVDDALLGLVNTNPGVTFHQRCPRVILRSDYKEYGNSGKVALVAGGGSGHEPFSAGLVGTGLLTAAVCGNIFASPPPRHIEAALESTMGKGGTVLFVINYTGDRLNFGLAAEMFKKRVGEDHVRVVTISEDVAIEEAPHAVGRRGLAACTLIMKIAGWMGEDGKSLKEIADFAEKLNEHSATLGVSLTACSLPGTGPMFTLPHDQMEIGLGVHGEPGARREHIKSAKEIVDMVLTTITNSKWMKDKIGDKKDFVVLLNNLGGVSQIEMGVLKKETARWFDEHNYKIARFFSGPLMTSLDGRGFSITLMPLIDDSILTSLDKATTAPGWVKATVPGKYFEPKFEQHVKNEPSPSGAKLNEDESKLVRSCIEAICSKMDKHREELNKLDGEAGDGDCGDTLVEATKAIHKQIDSLQFAHPRTMLCQLALLFQEDVGGTTGAIYALLLHSKSFEKSAHRQDWIETLENGVESQTNYGRARKGDRTMLDTLLPVLDEMKRGDSKDKKLEELTETIKKVAHEAAEATASMKAEAGRASYTSKDVQTKPDAGAMAVAHWITAICDVLTGRKEEE